MLRILKRRKLAKQTVLLQMTQPQKNLKWRVELQLFLYIKVSYGIEDDFVVELEEEGVYSLF